MLATGCGSSVKCVFLPGECFSASVSQSQAAKCSMSNQQATVEYISMCRKPVPESHDLGSQGVVGSQDLRKPVKHKHAAQFDNSLLSLC